MCSVCAMGRRKVVGLVVVTALTVLNIWMARYVIQPLNEASMHEQHVAPRGRKLSDVLVISVDDVHPIQHLQEAADEKRETAHSESLPQHATHNPLGYGHHNNDGQHRGNNMPFNNTTPRDNNKNYPPYIGPGMTISTGNRQSANSQNDLSNLSASQVARGDLNMLDTRELLDIKHNLEALKNLMGTLNVPSITHSPMSARAENPPSRTGWQGKVVKYQDANVKSLGHQNDEGNVLNETAAGLIDNSILDYFKDNLNPPLVAAKAVPDGPNTYLLNKLLSETNMDSLQKVLTNNAGSVRDLLSQILQQLQQRQQVILSRRQHQQPHIIPSYTSPFISKQQPEHNPYGSHDYNKGVAREMMQNILKYNYPEAYSLGGTDRDNFLRHFQLGYVPTDLA